MLLLMVLSTLTLFLLIGSLGLVLATRARESARAFAAASASESGNATLAKVLLDEALMKLIRGPSGAAGQLPESLLADKYGTSQQGQLTAAPTLVANSPLLQATITGINTSKPMALQGRIVTFVPDATDPSEPVSYRIVEVVKDSTTFRLANARPSTPAPLPSVFPCRAVVNGREFAGVEPANEFYDAGDANNSFLTVVTATSMPVVISRPAFQTAGPAVPEFDNDGDGVLDGVKAPKIFPDRSSRSGSTLSFDVSYLVLDLDGRMNLNAHGRSGPPLPTDTGPASVDISSLVGASIWPHLLTGRTTPSTTTTSSSNQLRPAPAVSGTLDGRYGQTGITDPYLLRLDLDAPRPSEPRARSNTTNPFTVAELESVLRQFDTDAPTLPPRLAALLDVSSQRLRLRVTTDSWDSPGLTKEAIDRLVAWADQPGNALSDLPPDIQAGLRFNLNRDLGNNGLPAKQKFFEEVFRLIVALGAPATEAAQWAANIIDFRDIDSAPGTYTVPGGTPPSVTGVEPNALTPAQAGWNDAFRSPFDLLGIPAGTLQQLNGAPLDQAVSLAVEHPVIVAACTVPSPFIGNGSLGVNDLRLSRWREPGKVNVCLCEVEVWNRVTGSSVTNPFPQVQTSGALGIYTRVPVVFDDTPAPPPPPQLPPKDHNITLFKRDIANRIGNIATVRSNMFAVWITLRINDSAVDSSPTIHRLFAIVDRSIPVGYVAGEDLNVRETIRLRRFLH